MRTMETMETAQAQIIAGSNGAATGGDAVSGGAFAFAWAALAVAVGVDVLGLVMNWYDVRYFDDVMHFVTFFAATLVLGLHLYGRVLTGRGRHAALLVFVVGCAGVALGVCWEWAEWAFDHASGPRNRIQGKTDTLVDLLMDTAGALTAGVAMLWLVRPRPGPAPESVAQSN